MSLFEDLLNDYLERVNGAHGLVARPNDTFYAHQVVTESIQWLRDQVMNGARLNESGQRFLAGAACYLAYISYLGFTRRGLQAAVEADWRPGDPNTGVALVASREREGRLERYGQDFFRDAMNLLLPAPQPFPIMHGAALFQKSLTITSPEFLYMTGTHYLSRPGSAGNWPVGKSAGGIEDDFGLSRVVLVEDLHTDLGLDVKDEALSRLSHWVVWPPYGWHRNEAGEYNMMTLVDQIGVKKVLPEREGVLYLRILMQSQLFNLRLIAARTLMVLGQAPASPRETRFYEQALNASDQADASPQMARLQWALTGNDPKAAPTDAFVEKAMGSWRSLADNGPREPWQSDPVLVDPVYRRLAGLGPGAMEEKRAGLASLRQSYPGDWFVEVADAFLELYGGNPEAGERRLIEAARTTPGDPVAHFSLGSWLGDRGRHDEARSWFLDAVRRWPWDERTVGNAMWSVTRGMLGQ